MRWLKRKKAPTPYVAFVHDGITRNDWSAYWWEPGCKCHWSAGIEGDYCDFCKNKIAVRARDTSPADGRA